MADRELPPLLRLDNPRLWPDALCAVLEDILPVMRSWELDLAGRRAKDYDRAMHQLGAALQPFALCGWHCTRFTANEASEVEAHGLDVLDSDLLKRRVQAQVERGELGADIAVRLLGKNQAHEPNRKGMAWFCFYPPAQAGEQGIGRLLRNWGGESLYNSHESDPSTGPILQVLGTPSLVEAYVPVSYLSSADRLSTVVARLDLVHRGECIAERLTLEDYSTRALAPPLLRRVLRYPDPEFVALTGCDTWDEPLNPR